MALTKGKKMETVNNILGYLLSFGLVASIIVGFISLVLIPLVYRRVVETNVVHIVQSAKKTTSYGKDTENGNVYYEWPKWLPYLGVLVRELPVSNFELSLNGYSAYDLDKVPFKIDVVAFFRISDTNKAAERVENFQELENQLLLIVQGAARTILANAGIDAIMLERATFGEQFTKEVENQLGDWGVSPVKNLELMDIRDDQESRVIENIMAKKKSKIEMESRKEVAENMKQAEIAEIEAKRETEIQQQQAEQAVGERTAEKDKLVGIADEQAQQEIKEQKAITMEKDMAVQQIETVRQAEITKAEEIVKADQERQTQVIYAEGIKQSSIVAANGDKQSRVIKAEGEKEAVVVTADGDLQAKLKEAEGIKAEGEAKADATEKMKLAEIQGEVVLAEKIGENEEYQDYMVRIANVDAVKEVGIANAGALEKSDLKIIANGGDVAGGMGGIMDILSSKGGTNIAAMLEGLSNSEQGKAILEKLGIKPEKPSNNSEKS